MMFHECHYDVFSQAQGPCDGRYAAATFANSHSRDECFALLMCKQPTSQPNMQSFASMEEQSSEPAILCQPEACRAGACAGLHSAAGQAGLLAHFGVGSG